MPIPAGPDPNVVSLEEVKRHGNITGTASDDELLSFIGTAQEMIEGKVGPLGPTMVTETHDAAGSRLWLHRTPVLSVTSVTEYSGATPLTPLTIADWTLNGEFGELRRNYGRWVGDSVRVTYQAGREPIPAAARWAVMELAIHLWRSTQTMRGGRGRGSAEDVPGTAGAGFGLPNRVEDVLSAAGLLRPPVVA